MFANVTSRAGQARSGSFRRKKNYIAKKEDAYRMFARRPTRCDAQTISLLLHGSDVTCFDVMKLLAG